ncbi:MAG TPA: class I SAM-dependent methyltransferase [Herbaspirillum sp.]|jgi:SAM-dependent methyltransferase
MTTPASSEQSSHWDDRFSEPGYAYGEQPNDFLVEACAQVPAGGDALSLCEGEGRNAVYLAKLGFRVTAVDFSEVGLAKARALAEKHGVKIDTIVADLADFDPGIGRWDLVLSIFAQPPSAIRQRLYRQMRQALRPQGRLVLETKVEIDATADGRYPGVHILSEELAPLTLEISREQERALSEGRYHSGMQRTAQILAINRL